MKKGGKILMEWNLTVKSVKIWVETINYGPAPYVCRLYCPADRTEVEN